ncbi:MAG: F0F1 ATP synthase subunit B [Nitrospirae bacterium]|nr:F0F1 ATP synthase subunit B [Nitrospirota bacterium]
MQEYRIQNTEYGTAILKNPALIIAVLFSLLCLTFPEVTFASGGEEGAAAEHHGMDWAGLIWPVFNFALLAGILIFFTRKPFRDYFANRTAKIESSIKAATEAKELAEKTLAEVRERLNNTEKETNQIIEAAKRAGEKEKEALIAEGEHIKMKIIEQAKAGIDFELARAKQALKSEAALLALEAAENEIKKRLGRNEHEKLIVEYINKIEVNG